MSIVKCKNCDRKVSDSLKLCACGAKVPVDIKKAATVCLMFLGIVLMIYFIVTDTFLRTY